jgi:hypothetical protein
MHAPPPLCREELAIGTQHARSSTLMLALQLCKTLTLSIHVEELKGLVQFTRVDMHASLRVALDTTARRSH